MIPQDLTVFGNKVLFDGFDASVQQTLWVTNGTGGRHIGITVAGAYSGGLNPGYFIVFGNEVLFSGL